MNSHAKQPQIRVVAAAGQKVTDRRGAVFIQGHADCVTQDVLKGLPDLVRRQLYARIGRWIDRPDLPWEVEKYHGWTSSQFRGAYVNCFVFKYHSGSSNARLYGFLSQPLARNPRCQIYVATELLHYKKGNPVDTKYLDRAVAVSREEVVADALRDHFSK